MQTLATNLVTQLFRAVIWNLATNLVANWLLGVKLKEEPNIFQVCHGKAARVRHLHFEVNAKSLEESATPRLVFLHENDIVPKTEVELQHLGVDCERRLYLALTISLGYLAQPTIISF